MATAVRAPAAVSSITFATSGVIASAAGIFSGITPAEVTACVYGGQFQGQPRIISTNAVTGNAVVQLPSVITSITINGNVYAANGANQISVVLSADANVICSQAQQNCFQLVTGA